MTSSCSQAHFSFNQSFERPDAYGASIRLAMSPSQPELQASANRRSESPRQASVSCSAAPLAVLSYRAAGMGALRTARGGG